MTPPDRAPRYQWFLVGLAIAVVMGLIGWAFISTSALGSMTGGSWALTLMIAGGAVGAGALTGVLMWLAFYSARKGFDDRMTVERKDRPE